MRRRNFVKTIAAVAAAVMVPLALTGFGRIQAALAQPLGLDVDRSDTITDEDIQRLKEAWECSVRVVNMDEVIGKRVPKWLALPTVASPDDCVFMTNPVRVIPGEGLDTRGVDRFVSRLQCVLDSGYFTGRLAPVVAIPLARHGGFDRMLLAAYIQTYKSCEQLNSIFGDEMFVAEGEIGRELPEEGDRTLTDSRPGAQEVEEATYERKFPLVRYTGRMGGTVQAG